MAWARPNQLDQGRGERTRTINAAVLVLLVQAVVLQDVQQAGHLAEDEHPAVAALQLGQQPVQKDHLACRIIENWVDLFKTKGCKFEGKGDGLWVLPSNGKWVDCLPIRTMF